jgi:hypothetical protein
MLIMEKKEYILTARENEGFHGQILNDDNIDNFIDKILNYFNIWMTPYKVNVAEYSKDDKGNYNFKVVTWEDSKK